MDLTDKDILWRQFGATIDTLENAMRKCPDEVWSDPSKRPEWQRNDVVGFWYVAYHTLFFLDYDLSDSQKDFSPPPPFTLDELDPAGLLPDRAYTKDELLTYLQHCRTKSRDFIRDLTTEKANERRSFPWGEMSNMELVLYLMRHNQHHAAQLNLLLRQTIDAAPGWVAYTKLGLT
jgi:hypothetical protein